MVLIRVRGAGTLQFPPVYPERDTVRPIAPTVLLIVSPALAGAPAFTPLGDLPGGTSLSRANAISADGSTIVGVSSSASGNEAFRWRAGVLTPLGDFPGGPFSSEATDCSGDGSVIVGFGTISTGEEHGFTLALPGAMVELPPGPLDGAMWSRADAVSRNGTIAGGVTHFGGLDSGTMQRATVWTGTSPALLPLIPAPLAMAARIFGMRADGVYRVGRGDRSGTSPWIAIFWVTGTGDFRFFPGTVGYAEAFGTTASGLVSVGTASSPNTERLFSVGEAVYWIGSDPTALGDLPGGVFKSTAYAISDDATVIVGQGTSAIGNEAFLWTQADGMRRLQDVIEDDFGIDLTGWTLTVARDVSAAGDAIVGWGTNPAGQQEAWLFRADCLARPAITQSPSITYACPGTGATFTAAAIGTPTISFHWRRNGIDLADGPTGSGSIISGSGSATLTLSNTALADEGFYDCVTQNACGSAGTTPVELRVTLAGDADRDGFVGLSDIALLTSNWTSTVPPAPPAADLDGNGMIGLSDLAAVITNWAQSCP